MYVYKETERWQDKGYTHILYTVGFYEPNGKWIPEYDTEKKEDAADRVAYLNGSIKPQNVQAIKNEAIDDFCEEHNICPICAGKGCTSDHK